jgi:glutamate carboxypeptidase
MREALALAYLDGRQAVMVDLVTRLAAVNSYSHHLPGLLAVAELLEREFAALAPDRSGRTDLPPMEAVDAAGAIVRTPVGPLLSFEKRWSTAAATRVLLVIHYDTVYAPNHPFQTVTRLDDRTLRGPGVADAKGGIVVLLNALLALERSPLAPRIGWKVLLNPDEEIGSPGSAELLAAAAREADIALVYEPPPTPAVLVNRRKGSGNFSVTFRGRSAHAGREIHLGRNAVLAAARFAVEATEAVGALGEGVTINVGKVDGGGPMNVVPDLAVLRFNCRAETPAGRDAVERRLAELVAEANRADGITAELHGHFSSPPWVMSPSNATLFEALESCGRELGLQLQGITSGGASDANKIASTGVTVLDSLGPVGRAIHSPDESVDVTTFVERAKLSALLLMKVAAGELPVRR